MKTKEEIVESHFGSDFHEVSQPCCLVHICNAMEEYAKAYHEDKTRWISVEEDMPQEHEMVLLYESKFGTIVYGFWNGEDFYQTFNGVYDGVSHWQPIPSLPKLTQNKV